MEDDKPKVTGVVEDVDEVEANVARLLGTANAEVLTEVYGEISLTIPASAEGNVNKLLKVLNRYLNSDQVVGKSDEGLSVFKAVLAVLEKHKGVDAAPPKNDTTAKSSKTVGETENKGKLGESCLLCIGGHNHSM